MHGQQGARAVYDEVLVVNLVRNPQRWILSDEGWAASFAASTMGGDWGVRSTVMLAPSAHLASAASTATLVLKLLPSCLHHISDHVHSGTPCCLAVRREAYNPCSGRFGWTTCPSAQLDDDPCCQRQSTLLLNSAVNDREKARPAPVSPPRRVPGFGPLPISSNAACGDGRRRHPGGCGSASPATTCASLHTCSCGVPCGCPWHARGWLVGKRSAGRHPRHGLLNDVVWACDAACPGPVLQGTGRTPAGQTGRCPDGVSLTPGHEAAV